MDLHGAPQPEGTNAARKHTADEASASKTPPAEALLLPTLFTHRDPAIPQPPAAEAAGGGEESHGSAAARWEQRGGAQIAFLLAGERGTGPRFGLELFHSVLSYAQTPDIHSLARGTTVRSAK